MENKFKNEFNICGILKRVQRTKYNNKKVYRLCIKCTNKDCLYCYSYDELNNIKENDIINIKGKIEYKVGIRLIVDKIEKI